MAVLLLQILQWILRIILFLLILFGVLIIVLLVVPVRYRAEGTFIEKKADIKGKITWFFYLVNMKFSYRDRFQMKVRVFGLTVYDSMKDKVSFTVSRKKKKTTKKREKEPLCEKTENKASESDEKNNNLKNDVEIDELAAWEKEIKEQEKEEAEMAKEICCKETSESVKSLKQEEQSVKGLKQRIKKHKTSKSQKERKSFSEKLGTVKNKLRNIIQKLKDIIGKIRDGKLKAEYYLELWNRTETQITFTRAKKKFGKMLKAILPRKWILTGEIGFHNPAATGQLMGVLGAMYPILGNKVQMVPNFENEVISLEGKVKGHIRLGNLLYQIISLVLNRYCFKFIKLVFDELGKGKKKES